MTSANAPLKNWHIAAASDQLGTDPLGVRIAGRKLVLFREKNGAVAALADLCPHQDLPLSTGWVVDGAVECLHHGLRFDGTGTCIHMPAQDRSRIPERFRITTFPVREVDGHIQVMIPEAEPSEI